MINFLSNVSLIATNSTTDPEPWMALALMIPFLLIWIAWMLVILLFWGFMFVFTIGGSILWIFMLVDLVKREFKTKDEKIVWVVILALTGVIGAIVYYFVVKKGSK